MPAPWPTLDGCPPPPLHVFLHQEWSTLAYEGATVDLDTRYDVHWVRGRGGEGGRSQRGLA